MGGPGSGPRRRGRPPKLNDDITEEIVRLLRAGNYLETAAACVGLSPMTLRLWMRNGAQQKRGIYKRFLKAVKKAEAEAEAHALVRIRQAGKQVWTAEAWYLERKFPSRWGRVERTVEGTAEETDRTKEFIKRKDVRDLLDEVARRVSMDGDTGGSGGAPK